MYNAPAVAAVRAKAQSVLSGLAAAYCADSGLLPPEWRPPANDEAATVRAIGDFLAGMTDRYALRQYRQLVGPVDLPEGI
jgi:dGTPase